MARAGGPRGGPAGTRMSPGAAPRPAGDVHVWTAGLDAEDFDDRRLLASLDDGEHARGDGFQAALHRRRFLRARALLRDVLSRYLDRRACDIAFGTRAGGKPFAMVPKRAAIEFSFSRSMGHCAIAVRRESPVGIDIETLRPLPDALRVARRHFRPSEVERLEALPDRSRQRAFLFGWCRKEADAKLTGEHLHDHLRRADATRVLTRCFRAGAGLVGAVAVATPFDDLRRFEWTPDAASPPSLKI